MITFYERNAIQRQNEQLTAFVKWTEIGQIVDYSLTSTKVVSGVIFRDQFTVACKHLQLGKVRIDTTLAMI